MCSQEVLFKEVLYGSSHNEGSSSRLDYVNKITHKCTKWLLTLFINLYGLGVSVAHYYICANKCGLDLWLFKISTCISVLMHKRALNDSGYFWVDILTL